MAARNLPTVATFLNGRRSFPRFDTMDDWSDLLAYSLSAGERILAKRTQEQRKRLGQFLTPPAVARYMAHQLGSLQDGDKLLDPAIGSGVLACAVVERAISAGRPLELHINGYEIDPELAQVAREVLARAAELTARCGVTLHTNVYDRCYQRLASYIKTGKRRHLCPT